MRALSFCYNSLTTRDDESETVTTRVGESETVTTRVDESETVELKAETDDDSCDLIIESDESERSNDPMQTK